jgi:hypothetical protein
MFRVKYNEDLIGTIECHFCKQSIPLTGNVHTYKDGNGVTRTHPDARNAIHSHFNHDDNSFIPVCTTTRMEPGTTPWEAVDEHGSVVARGRVVIRLVGNAIQGPSVEQDEPA